MDREVVWAVAASDNLVSIAEYIARDSEFYAAAMVRELIGAVRSLHGAEAPGSAEKRNGAIHVVGFGMPATYRTKDFVVNGGSPPGAYRPSSQ